MFKLRKKSSLMAPTRPFCFTREQVIGYSYPRITFNLALSTGNNHLTANVAEGTMVNPYLQLYRLKVRIRLLACWADEMIYIFCAIHHDPIASPDLLIPSGNKVRMHTPQITIARKKQKKQKKRRKSLTTYELWIQPGNVDVLRGSNEKYGVKFSRLSGE
jgi:hypothetical protein